MRHIIECLLACCDIIREPERESGCPHTVTCSPTSLEALNSPSLGVPFADACENFSSNFFPWQWVREGASTITRGEERRSNETGEVWAAGNGGRGTGDVEWGDGGWGDVEKGREDRRGRRLSPTFMTRFECFSNFPVQRWFYR